MNRLVIVGGGFTGAIVAIHALRAARSPLQIDIVEPRADLGIGLAYATPHAEHRLNVPTHRMTLFDEDPAHFREWFFARGLDRSDRASDAGEGYYFARRRDFGRYMVELLEATVRDAAPDGALRHHRTTATDIERVGEQGWRLRLADRRNLDADLVAVCIGHTTTTPPPPFNDEALTATGRVLADPWNAEAIRAVGPDARILILGQGLTMGDVLSTLEAQDHRGQVVALSRRGLLARPYTDSPKAPVPFDSLPDDAHGSAVIRLMRDACEDAVRAGLSWNSVILTTRELGGTLWRRLAISEQCRLIRHARIFWDAHRYRMAPQVARTVDRALQAGCLHLRAGRVVSARSAAKGDVIDVRIRLHPRSGSRQVEGRFELVISCVGPTHNVATIENPFVEALLRRRFAQSHPTRLGFSVGRNNALVHDGQETAGLHVIGPLSRGACGDIVGVPEISRQAREVIESMLAGAGTSPRQDVRGEDSRPFAAA
jgi:Uncharacterized protein conserved in bacteria